MTIEAMLGSLEQMVETCLEMKAQLEQERERREKKRDERKEAKERRDTEEPKKSKESSPSSSAGAGACVCAYRTRPTITDIETHCVLKHVDKAYARKWLDYIESEGWHFSGGALITRSNFRTSFNAWYRRERRLERRAAEAASTTAKSWKEREFEAREAEIKHRREEADRKAREEGLRILGEMKRNGGL